MLLVWSCLHCQAITYHPCVTFRTSRGFDLICKFGGSELNEINFGSLNQSIGSDWVVNAGSNDNRFGFGIKIFESAQSETNQWLYIINILLLLWFLSIFFFNFLRLRQKKSLRSFSEDPYHGLWIQILEEHLVPSSSCLLSLFIISYFLPQPL